MMQQAQTESTRGSLKQRRCGAIRNRLRMMLLTTRWRQLMLCLWDAKSKGYSEGWRAATAQVRKQYSQMMQSLRDNHADIVAQLQAAQQAEIAALLQKHAADTQALTDMYAAEKKRMQQTYEDDIAHLKRVYELRAAQNDALREEAVRSANELRDNARRIEDYWRQQSTYMHDFLVAATSVINTIAERYEHVQTSLSKVQVGKEMVDDLKRSYHRLIKDVQKSAPPLLGDTELFKNGR